MCFFFSERLTLVFYVNYFNFLQYVCIISALPEDAISVTVTVLGNEIGDPNSNPGRNCLSFPSRSSFSSHELIVGQVAFFNFCKSTTLNKGKLKIQTSCTSLKIGLVSHFVLPYITSNI